MIYLEGENDIKRLEATHPIHKRIIQVLNLFSNSLTDSVNETLHDKNTSFKDKYIKRTENIGDMRIIYWINTDSGTLEKVHASIANYFTFKYDEGDLLECKIKEVIHNKILNVVITNKTNVYQAKGLYDKNQIWLDKILPQMVTLSANTKEVKYRIESAFTLNNDEQTTLKHELIHAYDDLVNPYMFNKWLNKQSNVRADMTDNHSYQNSGIEINARLLSQINTFILSCDKRTLNYISENVELFIKSLKEYDEEHLGDELFKNVTPENTRKMYKRIAYIHQLIDWKKVMDLSGTHFSIKDVLK